MRKNFSCSTGPPLTLPVQRVGDEDVREAQWIQADLKEVGVRVGIEVVDPATGIDRRRNHDFTMTKALRGVHLPDHACRDRLNVQSGHKKIFFSFQA